MSKLIEDFSVNVEIINPKTGLHGMDYVSLKVMDWGRENLIAYTFNSDSENTAKQLYKALLKYGTLTFITGVTGDTANTCIQHTLAKRMEKYKDVEIKVNKNTLYRLKK